MTSKTCTALAAASLALAASCAHGERKQAAAPPAASAQPGAAQTQQTTRAQQAAQTQAQQAQAAAAASDRDLAQARQQLDAAHQSASEAEQRRAQARQQLEQADQAAGQAQQRVSAEQARVQQLDAASREQHARAEQAAMNAQIAAEEARGLRTVSGRIAESTPTHVLLQQPDGRTLAFDVVPRTKVLVGAEQRSVADLQQGADARVAYDPRSGTSTAEVIHVSSARAPAQPDGQQSPPQR